MPPSALEAERPLNEHHFIIKCNWLKHQKATNTSMERMMLLSFLIASLVSIVNARSGGGDNYIFDFELCPEQFAFAFDSGRKCCSERPDWSQKNCTGNAVTCDSTRCEDRHSCDFVIFSRDTFFSIGTSLFETLFFAIHQLIKFEYLEPIHRQI